MKKISLILLSTGLMISSCKKKDAAPVGVPGLSTAAITNITADKATSGGTISSDGGAAITASGICWSKTNVTPSLADSKTDGTATSGSFNAELTGLSPSVTYYVRAYATNSAGTGYGNVITFTTGNAGPMAINISVTGDTKVNATLTANYSYSDTEGDLESGTAYKWYVANDGTGTGEIAIAGATAKTYVVQATEQGKYIRVGVTAKAATGTLTGSEIKSPFIGGIGEATTVSFTYNGVPVTYGMLTSVTTGRKWLDRNLGAANIPTSTTDFANYGDLFQWGRGADGHQLVTRTGPNDADVKGVNGTTSGVAPFQYSSTDNAGHSKFIIVDAGEDPFDWRLPQNNNLWQGTNPTNNPCPSGWHIPTKEEWAAENITSLADGFSKLKITLTGGRFSGTGAFVLSAFSTYYTSSFGSDNSGNPTYATRVVFGDTFAQLAVPRATGLACRCIKN